MSDSPTDDQLNSDPGLEEDTVPGAAAGEEGADPADSPPANSDEENRQTAETALDVVQKAIGDQPETSSTSEDGQEDGEDEPPSKPEAAKAEDGEEEALPDPTEDELKRYKPATAKRMRQLLAERNEAREERDQVKEKAGTVERLQEYFGEAGLTPDDINNGFHLMKMVKTDPQKALEALDPIVRQLRQVTGDDLPDDLRRDVQLGNISEQRARELSRTRASHTLAETRNQEAQTREERRQAAERQQALANDVGSAISQWERQWSSNDPDYKQKAPWVQKEIKAQFADMQRDGKMPRNAEEALAVAKKAKETVDAEFRKLAPRRQPENPVTGEGTRPQTRRQPNSPMEVIDMALGVGG